MAHDGDGRIRRGTLAGGVKVKVDVFGENNIYVVYRGTIDALVALGCISPSLLEKRVLYRRGNARGLRDENGRRYRLHRQPTLAMPNQMCLTRPTSAEHAIHLPGVKELFPNGLVGAAIADVTPDAEASPRRPWGYEKFCEKFAQLDPYGKAVIGKMIDGFVAENREKDRREHRQTFLKLVVNNDEP